MIVEVQGALGKLAITNIRNPKQILQIKPKQLAPSNVKISFKRGTILFENSFKCH